MTLIKQENNLIDPLTNLVKSVAEVTPTLVAPYADIWSSLLYEALPEHTMHLVCVILTYLTQSKQACFIMLQQQKHMFIIEAAYWLMASEETGNA